MRRPAHSVRRRATWTTTSAQVSPRYLVGLHGTVVGLDDHAATVRLEHPVGRFANGRVRCPPLTLVKLPSPPG